MELGASITRDFTTHNPATGEVSHADVIPTCEVFEDTTDVPILTPTVTERTGKTGDYRVTFIASEVNGFECGKSYNVIITTIVNGKTAKARIASFNLSKPSIPKAIFKI